MALLNNQMVVSEKLNGIADYHLSSILIDDPVSKININGLV